MDVILFSKIARELLADNDKVVLPGFGAFVAEDVPASFSDRGFTLNPPYRTVSFVFSEEKDDLLARFYATSNNIGTDKAQMVIAEFVSGLRDSLEKNKTVTLPEFGRLRYAGYGRVVFVPDDTLSIFPHLDYLEPISLKSLGEVAEEPDPERGKTAEPVSEAAGGFETASLDGSETGPEEDAETKKRMPVWAVVLIVFASVVVLALAALAVTGRVAPDIVDPYLYNGEQLEIIRTEI